MGLPHRYRKHLMRSRRTLFKLLVVAASTSTLLGLLSASIGGQFPSGFVATYRSATKATSHLAGSQSARFVLGIPVAPACTPVAAVALAVIGISHCRRVWRATKRSSVALQASTDDLEAAKNELAEATAAAEAAKLGLEAAKLRAEAMALEREVFEERRRTRARKLLGSLERVRSEELRVQLKELDGLDLTELQAQQLLAAVGRTPQEGEEASLSFEDLCSEAFESELGRFLAEMRLARGQKQLDERARVMQASKDEAQRRSEPEGFSTTEEINDDRSMGTRILGTLAYLLPLVDAFRFAIPLVQFLPPLAILLAPIALASAILNAVPFGTLIFFVVYITLAQNKEIPRLLRFNLEQSVLLDIALILPNLFVAGLTFAGSGEAVPAAGAVIFVLLLLVVLYCVTTTLGGEDPDGIPVISKAATNVIDRETFFDQ